MNTIKGTEEEVMEEPEREIKTDRVADALEKIADELTMIREDGLKAWVNWEDRNGCQ